MTSRRRQDGSATPRAAEARKRRLIASMARLATDTSSSQLAALPTGTQIVDTAMMVTARRKSEGAALTRYCANRVTSSTS